MAELYAGRNVGPEEMYLPDEAADGMRKGFPTAGAPHLQNSRLAQELGKWADTQPGGEAVHEALYRAYFVDARNINPISVILVVSAGSVGLPAEEARQILVERRFKDAVDADWEKSHKYGVTGVPTFVSGGYGVVGAQPYEVLEELLPGRTSHVDEAIS